MRGSAPLRLGIDARMYTSAYTGIGRYVYELIAHLLKIDHENSYTLFFNEPEYSAFHPPRNGVHKVLVNAPIYSFSEQTTFLKKLWDEKLDLMHFTHFNAPFFYRRLSIVTIHDLTLSFFPGKKMTSTIRRIGYQAIICSIAKRAKRVITVSEHTKKDINRMFSVPPEKIFVIHEGVSPMFHHITDPHIIQEFRKKLRFENPYILYTGNWRDHKNLVSLIKAFAILKEKYKLPHYLVITGREDPWYPEVKKAVSAHHLEGHVRFTGLVPDEDLVLLYNAAEVYAFPSFYEGFGLPALEAFACGTPVACSNTSSLPEVCGDAAGYFDPKDIEGMARVIADIIKNPKRQEELQKKGFERIKLFSWENLAKETLKVYLQNA